MKRISDFLQRPQQTAAGRCCALTCTAGEFSPGAAGAAPHVMEPAAPGAEETVVSLYHTLDASALRAQRSEIHALFARNACLRNRAARYIASAGSLLLDSRRAAACSTDFGRARSYAKRLAARLLPRRSTQGSEQLRFLSGITPKGPVFWESTVTALASRYLVFQDEEGACARLILEVLRAEALARGYSIISCRCAMCPEDKIDHILIPQLRLALLTSNSWHTCRFPHQKNVHCARFSDRVHLSCFRSRLRFNRKAAQDLLQQAIALMAQAKACHDELEGYYRAAVDFSAVEAATLSCARMLSLTPQPMPRPEP